MGDEISGNPVIWCFRRVLERLAEAELMKLVNDPELNIANASLTTYVAGEDGKLKLTEFAEIPESHFWKAD